MTKITRKSSAICIHIIEKLFHARSLWRVIPQERGR